MMHVREIALTRIFVRHSSRLFHEIDLEPDKEFSGATRFPRDRNHGQEIHKGLTASAIIDQAYLRFCPRGDHIFEI
jgi:hypothetical protein